jgi:hypothetical protein
MNLKVLPLYFLIICLVIVLGQEITAIYHHIGTVNFNEEPFKIYGIETLIIIGVFFIWILFISSKEVTKVEVY